MTPVVLENPSSDRWFARSRRAWVLVLSASCLQAPPRHHGGLPTFGAVPRAACMPPRAHRRRRHPRPQRGREDRPRPRQDAARRPVRGDRRGRRLRPTAPATRRARTAPRSSSATSVRGGRRRGDPRRLGGRRSSASARTSPCSPATTSTSPAELVGGARRAARAPRPTTSRARAGCAGGRVEGPTGGRGLGTRIYSLGLQRPGRAAASRMRRTASGSSARRSCATREIDLDQAWLTSYDLEPYVLYKAIRGGYRVIEIPCTVRYHAREGYTKMRGLRDWWRLFRPAAPAADRESSDDDARRSASFGGRPRSW